MKLVKVAYFVIKIKSAGVAVKRSYVNQFLHLCTSSY
jgi:hypothetical protein